MSKQQHGTNPGRAGYNRGCRCAACCEAQRRYQLDYRRRRAAGGGKPLGTAPAQGVDLGPLMSGGPVEAVVRAQIEGIKVQVWAAPVFRQLALLDARLLDTMAAQGQTSGVSAIQCRLLNVMDRLRQGPPPAGGVPPDLSAFEDDFLNDL